MLFRDFCEIIYTFLTVLELEKTRTIFKGFYLKDIII